MTEISSVAPEPGLRRPPVNHKPAMHLVRDHLHAWDKTLIPVVLPVDRLTLAKRRWRATAPDGTDFGFDLEHPLTDGDTFFQTDDACYRLAQQPEPVLELSLPPSSFEATQLGWKLGNLHFPIAVGTQTILTPDDPAIRQMLDREGIAFHPTSAIFKPLGGGHSHGHAAH